jgi:hypothetical protein
MLTNATIVKLGLNRFPEARPKYDALVEGGRGDFPGVYNVYWMVFRPLFADALERTNDEMLSRFGDFFEEIFRSNDVEAHNVIWLKFFKWLFVREMEFNQFLPFCGPQTKIAMKDAAIRWNVNSSIKVKLLC